MTAVDEHPLVARARRLADTLLAPAATDVDGGGVPRSHLDALAAAGLLGLHAPVAAGGQAAPAPVVRREPTGSSCATSRRAGASLASCRRTCAACPTGH